MIARLRVTPLQADKGDSRENMGTVLLLGPLRLQVHGQSGVQHHVDRGRKPELRVELAGG